MTNTVPSRSLLDDVIETVDRIVEAAKAPIQRDIIGLDRCAQKELDDFAESVKNRKNAEELVEKNRNRLELIIAPQRERLRHLLTIVELERSIMIDNATRAVLELEGRGSPESPEQQAKPLPADHV